MKLYRKNLQKIRDYVLEEMAMMMIEPVEGGDTPFLENEDFYLVRANYTGVFNGTLTVICQTPFADLLPKNLLGLMPDETVEDADRLDAIKELTNVISGNFLSDAFGEETVFDLPEFETGKVDYNTGMSALNDEFIYCLGDGEPLGLSFEIKAD